MQRHYALSHHTRYLRPNPSSPMAAGMNAQMHTAKCAPPKRSSLCPAIHARRMRRAWPNVTNVSGRCVASTAVYRLWAVA
mmetsp:Transcript_11154/g.25736  ORF Transcript_11154/g.25736 Transcript_11154/m.25736 type:complete len:80 (-) Transcript_11154:312-551(-)